VGLVTAGVGLVASMAYRLSSTSIPEGPSLPMPAPAATNPLGVRVLRRGNGGRWEPVRPDQPWPADVVFAGVKAVRLELAVRESGYLYVVAGDPTDDRPDATPEVLFPPAAEASAVQSAAAVAIPPTSDALELASGKASILVIWSAEPVSFFEEALSRQRGGGRDGSAAREGFATTLATASPASVHWDAGADEGEIWVETTLAVARLTFTPSSARLNSRPK
jgi:hypothetical protein